MPAFWCTINVPKQCMDMLLIHTFVKVLILFFFKISGNSCHCSYCSEWKIITDGRTAGVHVACNSWFWYEVLDKHTAYSKYNYLPPHKNRMGLYFARREIKSLSQILRQVNCFNNLTQKGRQYKHTLWKGPIILTKGKKTLNEIVLYS